MDNWQPEKRSFAFVFIGLLAFHKTRKFPELLHNIFVPGGRALRFPLLHILPGKVIQADVKQLRHGNELCKLRHCRARLPFADSLPGNAQLVRKPFLREPLFRPKADQLFGKAHIVFPFHFILLIISQGTLLSKKTQPCNPSTAGCGGSFPRHGMKKRSRSRLRFAFFPCSPRCNQSM